MQCTRLKTLVQCALYADLVNLLRDIALPAPAPRVDELTAALRASSKLPINIADLRVSISSNRRALLQPGRGLQQQQAAGAGTTPNDPLWSTLWNLRAVDSQGAWNTTQGARDVVVAVIDTGCDVNHPDLKDNLWVNPRESADGLDNDGNGEQAVVSRPLAQCWYYY